MPTKKQSLLRIIAATSASIFTLFSTFFGTYAWYTAVRSRKSEADTFNVTYTNDFLDKIDVYSLKDGVNPTEGDDKKITYTFSDTSVDEFVPGTGWTNKASLNLGTFDPLNISPTSLILITLKDLTKVSTETLNRFKLSLTTTTAYADCLLSGSNKFTETGNKFSSVLTFSALPLTSTKYTTATATSGSIVFSFAAASPSSTSSFVEAIPTSGTSFESTNYQTQFSILANSTSSNTVTTDTKYIALFPQYSKDIMEFLFTLNLNNSVLNEADVIKDGIKFTCDWGLSI